MVQNRLITLPTLSGAPKSSSAWLRKLLLGLVVFGVITWGGTTAQTYLKMHEPLPDAGGRQGRCVLWFVGSSSIYRWNELASDMAPWITHNRGVGGAFLPELRQRFANETVSVPPEAIIFYGGDNDIARGQNATDTADQFREFVMVKMAKMPRVPMLTLGVKPSPARWQLRNIQLAYDRAVRETAPTVPSLAFVDASHGLLVHGQPGPFFEPDGIHLSTAGYKVWARVIRQALAKMLPRSTRDRCEHGQANPASSGG